MEIRSFFGASMSFFSSFYDLLFSPLLDFLFVEGMGWVRVGVWILQRELYCMLNAYSRKKLLNINPADFG